MERILFFTFILSLFFSCLSSKSVDIASSAPIDTSETIDRGTVIQINNPTVYDVYFDGGQRVAKGTNGTDVTLYIETGALSRGFEILYEIPLNDTVPLYCKGDYRTFRENQSVFTITEPNITDNYGIYIKIKNNVNNAISFCTGGNVNPSWEQKGSPKAGNYLTFTNKREFSKNETPIFDISRDIVYSDYFIKDGRKENIPLNLPNKVEKNYLYSYEYSGQGVELTDVRPLHRVCESSWVKTIPDATGILPLVSDDNTICLFASTGKNIIRYDYDSSGNDKKTKSVNSGEDFTVSYTSSANNGFFIAGYEEQGRNKYKPVARVTGADGVLRRFLPEITGYESARYFSAARKDDMWLLAGDGVKNGSSGAVAYARLVRDDGNKLIVVNEWGGSDFPKRADNGRPLCGNIQAVAYNPKISCWLITGEIINETYNGVYLARINNDKTIQILDTFAGIEIYKILVDDNGAVYLAGQEEKENKVFAVIIKWDEKNKIIWQLKDQPQANSFYYDAVIDSQNKNIVLAGTMQAKDEYGEGGKPFIEAIDFTNEKLVWRETLSSAEFNGTNLVTALTSAPDYGYVLTLSGIDDGVIHKPFRIARINSQGKFLKY